MTGDKFLLGIEDEPDEPEEARTAPLRMILHLPLPPSTNSLYATNFTTKRRFKSAKYGAWIIEATTQIISQQRGRLNKRIPGKIKVDYVVARPKTKRRTDLANYEKALSDILVSANVIDDDSKIQEIRLRWGENDGVIVIIDEWEG